MATVENSVLQMEMTGLESQEEDAPKRICIPPPPFSLFQFIITDKAISRREGVGVMNDEKFKFEEIESPHTLGGTGRWYTVVIHT